MGGGEKCNFTLVGKPEGKRIDHLVDQRLNVKLALKLIVGKYGWVV